MSLQAIRNGLAATLTACGPYAAAEISTCAFDVLESSAACAVTFFAGKNTSLEEMTFGRGATDIRHWSIEGSVWIKDTGNVENLLAATWQAHDDLYGTLKKDRTLNGAARNAHVTGMSYDPETAYDAAGAIWQRIFWTLTADEYDS
jgi:hypothetical protein